MYKDLSDYERLLLAIEFHMSNTIIPEELKELLGEEAVHNITNTQEILMTTTTTSLIPAATRDLLSIILTPKPLAKGDGEFEIGREVMKLEMKLSLEAFSGIKL